MSVADLGPVCILLPWVQGAPDCSGLSASSCEPWLLLLAALRVCLLTPEAWVMLQLSASPADGFAHRIICLLGTMKMTRGFEVLWKEFYLLESGLKIDPWLGFFTGWGDGRGDYKKKGRDRNRAVSENSKWKMGCGGRQEGENHGGAPAEAGWGVLWSVIRTHNVLVCFLRKFLVCFISFHPMESW